jgi:hypothetical protein
MIDIGPFPSGCYSPVQVIGAVGITLIPEDRLMSNRGRTPEERQAARRSFVPPPPLPAQPKLGIAQATSEVSPELRARADLLRARIKATFNS